MENYVKLFGSIIHSTVWQTDLHIKVVWITMLAMADKDGQVWASVPGLSKAAGVSLDQCNEALRQFLSPDPYSRTKDHEGRRIEEIDGGWKLLNYRLYRHLASPDPDDKANAAKQKRYRDRQRLRSAALRNVTPEAEAYTNTEEERKNIPPIVPQGTKRDDLPKLSKETAMQNLDLARKLWPGKKRGIEVEFENFAKKNDRRGDIDHDWRMMLDDDGIANLVQSMVQRKSYSSGFWPHFSKFVNQRLWEIVMEPEGSQR